MKLHFWFLLSSLFSVFGKSGIAAVIAMGIMATPGVQDPPPLVPFRNYQQAGLLGPCDEDADPSLEPPDREELHARGLGGRSNAAQSRPPRHGPLELAR
jgi:hypothetical protein